MRITKALHLLLITNVFEMPSLSDIERQIEKDELRVEVLYAFTRMDGNISVAYSLHTYKSANSRTAYIEEYNVILSRRYYETS